MYCKFLPMCNKAHHSKILCKLLFLECDIYNKFCNTNTINVSKMDIQEIFAKAFDIGNKSSFKVRFYDKHGNYQELFKEMTYTELGMYLINNKSTINIIHIFEKK